MKNRKQERKGKIAVMALAFFSLLIFGALFASAGATAYDFHDEDMEEANNVSEDSRYMIFPWIPWIIKVFAYLMPFILLGGVGYWVYNKWMK